MTYRVLDVIKDIEDALRADANQAHEEKQRIDAEQAEIDAQLKALEPRLLRAKQLESNSDLICAHCFIYENTEFSLRPIPSKDPDIDLFRCSKCKQVYELAIP